MSLGWETPEVCPACFWSLGQRDAENNAAVGRKTRPGEEGKDRGGGQAGGWESLPVNYFEAGHGEPKVTTALRPQCGWGDLLPASWPAVLTATDWIEQFILSSYEHFF